MPLKLFLCLNVKNLAERGASHSKVHGHTTCLSFNLVDLLT